MSLVTRTFKLNYNDNHFCIHNDGQIKIIKLSCRETEIVMYCYWRLYNGMTTFRPQGSLL